MRQHSGIIPITRHNNNMKLSANTLRFGNPDWMRKCAPTLEAWCQRHGYPLRVWGDEFPQYPCPKFGEIEMLREFLQGDSDMFLYVDADVIVHKDAPELDIVATGFHAATDDWHSTHTEQWRVWCDETYTNRLQNGAIYHNAGVWACDREAAQRFLAQAQPPFIERLMEEFQWNWWLVNAVREGMEFHTLPDKWNHSNKSEVRTFPVWFLHVWGSEKHDEINELLP